MIYSFLNSSFLKNMMSIMDEHGIDVVLDESIHPVLKWEEKLDGFGSQNYLYFYEAINKRMGVQGLKLASVDFVFFCTSGSSKKYYFGIKKDLDEYTLCGETPKSMQYFLRNVMYSGNGLILGFDKLNKSSIDNSFAEGKLSIVNNYMSQQYGLQQLEALIKDKEQKAIEDIKDNFFLASTDEDAKSIKSLFDMTSGRNRYENYEISLYVMSVFSYIEHVAILVLPFWFAMRNEKTLWNDFCNGFRASVYDTFRDFWTNKDNWIDSFIETLCGFRRYSYKKPDGWFVSKSEKDKSLKRLYERLRTDYRNPIHHGLSTGENRTGLSLEVPSLKHRVRFNMPPLMREIDSKTFVDSKQFLELFLEILKNKNPQIVEYLETELNVPVDCSELASYVLDENIEDFICRYRKLESHSDEIVRMQADDFSR